MIINYNSQLGLRFRNPKLKVELFKLTLMAFDKDFKADSAYNVGFDSTLQGLTREKNYILHHMQIHGCE